MSAFRSSFSWGVTALAMAAAAAAVYLLLSPSSHDASAANTPVQQTEATVETVHPARVDMARTFDTNATMEAFETADLYPKVSGYLSEVRVDIGDHVKAGQVLAIISLPETEKELAEAEATVARSVE